MSDGKQLKRLARDWGYGSDVDGLLRDATFDSISPGICPKCGYSTDVEPDQNRGWCEECEAPTVRSALVLAGLI